MAASEASDGSRNGERGAHATRERRGRDQREQCQWPRAKRATGLGTANEERTRLVSAALLLGKAKDGAMLRFQFLDVVLQHRRQFLVVDDDSRHPLRGVVGQ